MALFDSFRCQVCQDRRESIKILEDRIYHHHRKDNENLRIILIVILALFVLGWVIAIGLKILIK